MTREAVEERQIDAAKLEPGDRERIERELPDGVRRVSPDLYDFQPGNGTRYFLLATPVHTADSDPYGRHVAFFWLEQGDRGGRGMLIDRQEPLHLAYFQEKTRIKNEPDAVALLCFLAATFGLRVAGIPRCYRREQWFRPFEDHV